MIVSYGSVIDSFVPPEIDLKQFLTQLTNHQTNATKVWGPRKKDSRHWIDVKEVAKCYGKGGAGCVVM